MRWVTVSDDLHAVQRHGYVIAGWVPEFLAYFETDARVSGRDNRVAERHQTAAGDLRYHSRQEVILNRAFLLTFNETWNQVRTTTIYYV